MIGVYVPAGFLTAMAFDRVANIVVCNRNIELAADRRMPLFLSVGGIACPGASFSGFVVHHLLEYVAAFRVLTGIVATMAWPGVALVLGKLKRRIIL